MKNQHGPTKSQKTKLSIHISLNLLSVFISIYQNIRHKTGVINYTPHKTLIQPVFVQSERINNFLHQSFMILNRVL